MPLYRFSYKVLPDAVFHHPALQKTYQYIFLCQKVAQQMLGSSQLEACSAKGQYLQWARQMCCFPLPLMVCEQSNCGISSFV